MFKSVKDYGISAQELSTGDISNLIGELSHELISRETKDVASNMGEKIKNPPFIDPDTFTNSIEQRKKAIEQAQRYIEVEIKEWGNLESRISFHRKGNKVTCVIHTKSGAHYIGRSSCHEEDVFNLDIGKAIALKRANGSNIILESFLNAPNPDKFAVGQLVEYRSSIDGQVTRKVKSVGDRIYFEGHWSLSENDEEVIDGIEYWKMKIVEDTDAKY